MDEDKDDKTTKDLASVLFHTAVIRSGFMLQNSQEFADEIETMLRLSMGVSLEEKVY